MNIFNTFLPKQTKIPYQELVHLYEETIKHIRKASFYEKGNIEDSFYGRYSLLVAHSYFMISWLQMIDKRLSQKWFDHMFAHMDVNLREAGISDMSVGKKMKKLAHIFYETLRFIEEGFAKDVETGIEVLYNRLVLLESDKHTKNMWLNYWRHVHALVQQRTGSRFLAEKPLWPEFFT